MPKTQGEAQKSGAFHVSIQLTPRGHSILGHKSKEKTLTRQVLPTACARQVLPPVQFAYLQMVKFVQHRERLEKLWDSRVD